MNKLIKILLGLGILICLGIVSCKNSIDVYSKTVLDTDLSYGVVADVDYLEKYRDSILSYYFKPAKRHRYYGLVRR